MADDYAGTLVRVTVDRPSIENGIDTPVPKNYARRAIDAYKKACAVALRQRFPGADVQMRQDFFAEYLVLLPPGTDPDEDDKTWMARFRVELDLAGDAQQTCEEVYAAGAFWPDPKE